MELKDIIIFLLGRRGDRNDFGMLQFRRSMGDEPQPMAGCHLSCIQRVGWALTQSGPLADFINGWTFGAQFTLASFAISSFSLLPCFLELSFSLASSESHQCLLLFCFLPSQSNSSNSPLSSLEYLFRSLRIASSLALVVFVLFLITHF